GGRNTHVRCRSSSSLGPWRCRQARPFRRCTSTWLGSRTGGARSIALAGPAPSTAALLTAAVKCGVRRVVLVLEQEGPVVPDREGHVTKDRLITGDSTFHVRRNRRSGALAAENLAYAHGRFDPLGGDCDQKIGPLGAAAVADHVAQIGARDREFLLTDCGSDRK